MTLAMSTVTADIRDFVPEALEGCVVLSPQVSLLQLPDDDMILLPKTVYMKLKDGRMSVQVAASNQDGGLPASFQWKAEFRVNDAVHPLPVIYFEAPAGETIDLADVLPATPAPPTIYVPSTGVGATGPAGPPGPPGPPGSGEATQGATGATGPMGVSTTLFEYTYATTNTPPPGAGSLRSNTTALRDSTQMWAHRLDSNDTDRKPLLMVPTRGTELYVQDRDDASCWIRYRLEADPVDSGDYTTYSVSLVETGPTPLAGNKAILFGVLQTNVSALELRITTLEDTVLQQGQQIVTLGQNMDSMFQQLQALDSRVSSLEQQTP